LAEPRVTVAIPTHNRVGYLREAIESCLKQTLSEIEVIVADNASTDETPEVVASIGDPRVELARVEENIGAHANLSRCLRLGSAPYLTILHDDDLMLPENLERKASLLDQNPDVGLVYSTYQTVDSAGRVLLERLTWPLQPDPVEPGAVFVERSMKSVNRIHMSAAVLRRSVAEGEAVDPADGTYLDFGLWLRLARHTSFGYVDEPLCAIRLHEHSFSAETGLYFAVGSTFHTQTLEQLRDAYRVKRRFLDRFGDQLPQVGRLRALCRKRVIRELIWLVDGLTRPRRRLPLTLRLLLESARVEPRVVFSTGAAKLLLASVVPQSGRDLVTRRRGRPRR
jgi:glycosyltransferase involved in cell wall biosynthesis